MEATNWRHQANTKNVFCAFYIFHLIINSGTKYETEIRRLIAIAKDAYENLNTVLRYKIISLETLSIELLCNIGSLRWQ